MGPYGPGGLDISIAVTNRTYTYKVAFTPFTWGLGWARKEGPPECVFFYLLCFKAEIQRATWI
jgi:hypothetical protein